MPLTRKSLPRQSSNSSLGSLNRPSTIDSSTHVTKEKAIKVMNSRRQSKRYSLRAKKEKETEALLQSPTPYWKVAKERGGTFSPPHTRSAKKPDRGKRLNFSPDDKENAGDNEKTAAKPGVLTFSPPDQEENRRREEADIERKEKCRQKRIRKARNSGQLLIFSPTMTNPAPLPTDSEDTANDESGRDSTSPTNMEVDVEADAESSQVSSTTEQSLTGDPDQIASEIKSMRESLAHMKSDEPRNKSKTFCEKLEERLERVERQIENSESSASEEKEHLMVENTRLQSQLEASARDSDSKVQKLEETKRNLESQCFNLENEKTKLCNQAKEIETELENARNTISTHKGVLDELKMQQEEEIAMKSKEISHLHQSNTELLSEIADKNARSEELAALVKTYEKKVEDYEAQLTVTNTKLDSLKDEDSKINSQIETYVADIEGLKAELATVREQKEEERQKFEAVDQASSEAFTKMNRDIESKNRQIADLQKQCKAFQEKLETEQKKLTAVTSDLENLKSDMTCSIRDHEASMKKTLEALKQTNSEKQDFEKQLKDALAKILDDEKQKEQYAATIEQNSGRMEEMQSQSDAMERRIRDLEQELKRTQQERDDAKERLQTSDVREEDLFQQLRASHRVRKDLHNRVMQLIGNIRVYVRVRPTLPGEEKSQAERSTANQYVGGKKRKHVEIEPEEIFNFPGMGSSGSKTSSLGADDPTKNLLEITEPKKDRGGLSDRRKKYRFGFDNVFNQTMTQEDVWEATEPLIQSAVDGFPVTMFAYGQTGSGKTFTMLGEEGKEGIIFRAVKKLFDSKCEVENISRGDSTVDLSVELLEIYNEKVRDLLVSNKGMDGKELNLKVTANEAVGNKRLPVSSTEEVAKILCMAQKRRCTKATASNAVSSRSHMLFKIHFKVESKSGMNRSGELNICDLAGSERLSKSEANAHVGSSLLKETKHINTSLSVLSNVIEKLQAGDANVPYRESKLTYLLQNSLGGNSKTLAIICCSPLQTHYHETLCSLRFAAKVNRVDLKAKANFSC